MQLIPLEFQPTTIDFIFISINKYVWFSYTSFCVIQLTVISERIWASEETLIKNY